MRGKIILYNVEEGSGLIVAQDKGKYSFTIEEWSDFETMPSLGLDVEFEYDIDNQKVKSVESYQAKLEKNELEKKLEDERKELKNQENLEDRLKKGKIDIAELSADNVPSELLDQCINSFFETIKNKTSKISKTSLIDTKFTLDFQKIKRFLFTAYHNLIELDPTIANPQITKIYTYITELNNLYLSYKKTHQYPKLAFSSIFLKNTKYKDVKRRLELNIDKMKSLKAQIENIDKLIKKLSIKISRYSAKSNRQYSSLTNELKKLKREQVDCINEYGTLREENELLVPITDEYFDKFYDNFSDKFSKEYDKNISYLEDLLNKLTFAFDKAMWNRAKKSKIVQHFFKEANIVGDYSIATYLKYYINSLDHSKLSEYNMELLDTYYYLEDMKTKYESQEH